MSLVLLLAGCSDGEEYPGLEDAALGWYQHALAGQSGQVYESLHPLHQEMVSPDEWAACWVDYESPVISSELDVEVTDVNPETLTIPGTDTSAEMVAVSVTFTAGGESRTETNRWVEVDGSWRWMLIDPSEPC